MGHRVGTILLHSPKDCIIQSMVLIKGQFDCYKEILFFVAFNISIVMDKTSSVLFGKKLKNFLDKNLKTHVL